MKILGALARLFSTVLNPLLMPTYAAFLALWTSVLCYIATGTRFAVIIVILGITCILPMAFIAVLHNFKFISDKRLLSRRERWLPYVFSVVCYISAAFYLDHVHAPMWFILFMVGSALTYITSTIINFWWKISAHMAGIASLLAFMICIHDFGLGAFNLFYIICALIILCGCLGSSRIFLDRHSFWQVAAGFANGFLWIYLLMMIFSDLTIKL